VSARNIQKPRSHAPAPAPAGKAVRFSIVVQACGRPEIVYLWTEPEANDDFMKAVHENRVMTLAQSSVGTRRDYGVIGFFQGENAAYLVFPKPLIAFHEKRVVGVNYDLIKIPGPVGPAVQAGAHDKSRARKPGQDPAKAKKFRVTLRVTAVAEMVQEIEADSKKEAMKKATQSTAAPDFSHARVSKKALRAESE
jgi:hypothetical protein